MKFRQNMSHCVPTFGKINVFIAYKAGALKDHYNVALSSWKCYLKSTNYTLLLVDVDNDPRVRSKCSQHKEYMFLRHCALLQYMSEADWTIALDADTGVINPEHCIEEYIDPRVDLIFHQRFHNYEIAADTFIVKNSTFARKFIKGWADWDFRRPKLKFDNRDNGALHKIPDVDKCGVGTLEGWYWRDGSRVSEEKLLDLLLKSETYHMKWPAQPRQYQKARVIPWFEVSELKRCHPNCMDRTKL